MQTIATVAHCLNLIALRFQLADHLPHRGAGYPETLTELLPRNITVCLF